MRGIFGGKAARAEIAIIRVCAEGDDAYRLILRMRCGNQERQSSQKACKSRRIAHGVFGRHFLTKFRSLVSADGLYIRPFHLLRYFGASSRIASALGSQ